MTTPPPPTRPRARAFVGLAAAVTVASAVDLLPLGPGVPHHTALPPLGFFADVRVVVARSPSVPVFAVGLAASLAARTVFLAAALGRVDRRGLRWCAGFYLVATAPALVAAAFGFAATRALYVGLLWVGAAVAALTALVLGSRPWRADRRVGGVGVVAGYLALLLVLSVPASLGGTLVQLCAVWVSAAVSFGAARRLGAGAGTADPASPRRRSPVGPGGVACVALLGALALPVTIPRPDTTAPPGTAGRGSLFVVPGVGGAAGTTPMFELDPAALGYSCERTWYFSYAGTGDGAPQRSARCPIRTGAPYVDVDTGRPLAELVATFRDQIRQLPPPVLVVAHSQGGWVAAAAVGEGGDRRLAARVDRLVLLGGFARGNPGYALEGSEPGAVGAGAMTALFEGLRATDLTSFDPRGDLARDVLAPAGAVDDLIAGAARAGTEVVAVRSAYDLPLIPAGESSAATVELCPVYVHHGDLPTSGRVTDQIAGVLADGPVGDSCPWWRRWPMRALTPFGAP